MCFVCTVVKLIRIDCCRAGTHHFDLGHGADTDNEHGYADFNWWACVQKVILRDATGNDITRWRAGLNRVVRPQATHGISGVCSVNGQRDTFFLEIFSSISGPNCNCWLLIAAAFEAAAARRE